jgi:hypothetical protein
MKYRAATKIMVLVSALLGVPGAGGVENFRQLSGPQIRARFAGMDLTDDVHWREAYERDGAFRSRGMG